MTLATARSPFWHNPKDGTHHASSRAPGQPAPSDDAATLLEEFGRIGASVGSSRMSEWAHHELHGYPVGAELPYYRRRLMAGAQDGDPESAGGAAVVAEPNFGAEPETNDGRQGLIAILDRRADSQSVHLVKGPEGTTSVSTVELADEAGAQIAAAVHGRVILVRDELGLPSVTPDFEVTKKQADRAVQIATTPPPKSNNRSRGHRSSGSVWSDMWSTVIDVGTGVVDFLGSHF